MAVTMSTGSEKIKFTQQTRRGHVTTDASRRYIRIRYITRLRSNAPHSSIVLAPFAHQPPFLSSTIKLDILKSVLAMAADAPASTAQSTRPRRASTASAKPSSKATKPATKAKAAPKSSKAGEATTKTTTKKVAAKKDTAKATVTAAHPSWKDMIKVYRSVLSRIQGLTLSYRNASQRILTSLALVFLAPLSRRYVLVSHA